MERNISVCGPNSRVQRIENSVLTLGKPIIGESLIGGKSGSWGENNKAHVFLCSFRDKQIIVSVLTKDPNDFKSIYYIGQDVCNLVFFGSAGVYLKHLVNAGGSYCVNSIEDGRIINSVRKDNRFIPASVTKVMTAIIALENENCLDRKITIQPLDVTGGSGSDYYPGDIININDAIYAMLMESSNTLANAIAREVGKTLKHFRKN